MYIKLESSIMKKIMCLLLVCLWGNLNCFGFTNSNLDIVVTQIPLTSHLKKYYNGYQYKITNVSKNKYNILSAQIINGNDGNIAFATTKNNEPSAIARTWMIAGPAGLFSLGIGWVLGLIATPIVAITSNNNEKKVQIECLSYTNLIPLGIINTGEDVNINTLVPIGSKPQLKITIQDCQTNVLYTIAH